MKLNEAETGFGKKPVIIEFVGVPGAGKTTLAAELTEALREQHAKVATSGDVAKFIEKEGNLRAWASYLVSIDVWRLVWRSLKNVCHSARDAGPVYKKSSFRKWIGIGPAKKKVQLARFLRKEGHKYDIFVFDEMIFQFCSTLAWRMNLTKDSFWKLIESFAPEMDYRVVVVRIDSKQAAHRIGERNTKEQLGWQFKLDKFSFDVRLNELQKFGKCIEEFVAYIERAKIKYCVLDSSSGQVDSTRKILNWIYE